MRGSTGPAGSPERSEDWRGKTGRMNAGEIAQFLAGGVICRLGCLDEDGWPYVVPVWFEYADQGFYVIARARSAWARHLQRDGRAFLCIDESRPPYRKVLVRGRARILEEPNTDGRWVQVGAPLARRYLGEYGGAYRTPTLKEPRWLIFVEPLRMTTWQGVDWARRYKHSAW
jgi:PPOX class probable F420-dependent enzyme